jgi:hypothetical protein
VTAFKPFVSKACHERSSTRRLSVRAGPGKRLFFAKANCYSTVALPIRDHPHSSAVRAGLISVNQSRSASSVVRCCSSPFAKFPVAICSSITHLPNYPITIETTPMPQLGFQSTYTIYPKGWFSNYQFTNLHNYQLVSLCLTFPQHSNNLKFSPGLFVVLFYRIPHRW